jgi:hypothetical protein
MPNSLNAMTVALRVLTALNDRRTPNPADVQELRRLAPLMQNDPLDELACEVVQQAMRRRAELRNPLSAAKTA